MAVSVRVEGVDKLRRFAIDAVRADRDDLPRELRRGLQQVAKHHERAVRREIAETMPHRGGYADVLDGSYRPTVSVRSRGSGAGITIIGRARGKANLRDLPSINAGRLRHPVFGRIRFTRRTPGGKHMPWAVTSVPAGFWDRPGDELRPELEKQAEEAIDRVVAKLEAG